MLPIEARLTDLLNETRIAMLGAQLLLGLQYRAAFSPMFARLPPAFQHIDYIALLLILVTVNLLLATPAFHQIAEKGNATCRMLHRASVALRLALLPLSLALGIDVSLGLVGYSGAQVAAWAGGLFVMVAWAMWFGLPFVASARSNRKEQPMEDKELSLEKRIEQALTEIRVVLPGAQALFGFQMSAVLTETFEHLSGGLKTIHLASLMLIVIAVVMLIAPAAYHRIAAGGDATPSVLNYTVWMMLPAEGLIALGLVADSYVTVRMISNNQIFAIVLSLALLVGFFMLLYIAPLMIREGSNRFRHGRA